MLLLGFILFLVWVVVHEIEMSESDTESGRLILVCSLVFQQKQPKTPVVLF